MVCIIVKGGGRETQTLKGKSVTELAKNLQSEGFPTEFDSEEQADRLAFIEKKEGRPLQKSDVITDGRHRMTKQIQEADKRGDIREVDPREIQPMDKK
jgi:hypothetical protein